MTSALQLYRKYSKFDLIQMQDAIANDPLNKNTAGGIYLLNKTARKKMDAIALAISWHIADDRAQAGNPVSQAGYSGRNSNRK